MFVAGLKDDHGMALTSKNLWKKKQEMSQCGQPSLVKTHCTNEVCCCLLAQASPKQPIGPLWPIFEHTLLQDQIGIELGFLVLKTSRFCRRMSSKKLILFEKRWSMCHVDSSCSMEVSQNDEGDNGISILQKSTQFLEIWYTTFLRICFKSLLH